MVSHDKDFLYEPRGFSSIQEHDKTIISNWNSIISKNDIVYHLGDVMLGNNNYGIQCLSSLNGNIKIIPGNHDTPTRLSLYKNIPNVEVLSFAEMLKYKKYNFYLSHYPTITSNFDDNFSLRTRIINLFGHTHQKDKFFYDCPQLFHVGMDSNNCAPVLLDDIIGIIKTKIKGEV